MVPNNNTNLVIKSFPLRENYNVTVSLPQFV